MIFIGIDPGNTGAVALLDEKGNCLTIEDFDTPGFMGWRLDIPGGNSDFRAAVEKVSAMPKQGVATTFKFGTAYGFALGMLAAYGIKFELVVPSKWQAALYDSATRSDDRKKDNLRLARRLFPEVVEKYLRREKDHNRADALLIAEYCRRMTLGVDF